MKNARGLLPSSIRCFRSIQLLLALLFGGAAVATPQEAPVITGQPQSRTNDAGSSAAFTVAVTGSEPLSYRWRVDGSDVAAGTNTVGTTNATLEILNVQRFNGGNYAVIISNAWGSVTSQPAALVVIGPLQKLVAEALPDQVIDLPPGTLFDTVVIEKNLTLRGAGTSNTTVSGAIPGNAVPIFIVGTNVTVTFKDFTITAGSNGAIQNLGALTLDGCAVTRCLNEVVKNDSEMRLLNTQIQFNGSISSGLTWTLINSGGASLLISNSTISRNETYDGTPGLINSGMLTMERSSLLYNHSVIGYRVGLDNGGTASIQDCDIIGNSSPPYNAKGILNGGQLILRRTRAHSNVNLSNYGLLILEDCSIRDNSQTGLSNGGTTIATNTSFCGNSTGYEGGGINNRGNLLLVNSSVCGNEGYFLIGAGRGGGIYQGGQMTAIGCSISGNLTRGDSAGGIYSSGETTLTRCILSGNRSDDGGALYIRAGRVTLTNCTISGNEALLYCAGGGIRNAAYLTLSACTIYNNKSGAPPGDVCGAGGLFNGGSATILNTIISGNTVGNQLRDVSGTIDSLGYNLIRQTNDATITGVLTGNLYGVDPQLGPLQNNGGLTATHALAPGCPAIDAGSPTDFPGTDQRGLARPVDGNGDGVARSDMGAYEFIPSPRLAPLAFINSGEARLRGLVGAPGQGYVIESSIDLKTWSPASTNTADFSGWFTLDLDAAHAAMRFYRIIVP